MVLTEALARGVPVLASDVGGVREAVGSGGAGRLPGILVPPGDPDALADALRRWLTDGGLRTELREAARERRGTLRGWDATADDVADALPGPVGAQS
jgi:glycosyltransferase involved in cell wall biosynthesis